MPQPERLRLAFNTLLAEMELLAEWNILDSLHTNEYINISSLTSLFYDTPTAMTNNQRITPFNSSIRNFLPTLRPMPVEVPNNGGGAPSSSKDTGQDVPKGNKAKKPSKKSGKLSKAPAPPTNAKATSSGGDLTACTQKEAKELLLDFLYTLPNASTRGLSQQ